jgi:prepilin-type processing-associated H-X9-DG protein
MNTRQQTHRSGFTIRDLAVTLTCLLVGASLLLSMTGATRSLSQTQACADNLRQLFAGLTSYVNQYNCYPPNNPYPLYMARETINGIDTIGWDPSIGFVMTHGLGLQPPRHDTATGHFIWYGEPFASLPDVCKCPSLPPATLDPSNPELDPGQLEPNLYQYALSYQTSGTMRSATRLLKLAGSSLSGTGGRNPPIPDPTLASASAQQYDNSQGGNPYVYAMQHDPSVPPDNPRDSGQEIQCWVQAVSPAEVQAPSRVYYLADSRDYRPNPPGTSYTWPSAGRNSGWAVSFGNKVFLGTRHVEYANVMYLDGRVSRGNQAHYPTWNMSWDSSGNGQSVHWRSSTFATNILLANIRTQVHTMPVLMVRGWEYFFETNGVVAK